MAISNPVGAGFISNDPMFKAFSTANDPFIPGASMINARPPAGSRLVQYMQTPSNKTPTFQNGIEPHGMISYQTDPMSLIPGSSQSRLTPPNPAFTPPNHAFSQMTLQQRSQHSVTPDAHMMKIHQSVSVPAFARQLSSSFEGNYDPSSPPGNGNVAAGNGNVARSMSRSPVVATSGPHDPNLSLNFLQIMPNFHSYSLPPPHIARLRPKGAGIASFFVPPELKMELINRQLLTYSQVNPEQYPDIPQEIDNYHTLVPLEPQPKDGMVRPGFFVAHASVAYKAVNTRDGLVYSLRRLLNCRLMNNKCLSMVDMWKKLIHSNVVQLREVFTTKLFGDYSLVFAYDYHAAAETLKYRHFSGMSRINGVTQAMYEELEGARNRQSGGGQKFLGNSVPGGLPESLIWTYVVQLSSALRAIHSAGLAARTVEPSKIIIVGKSKLLINCCGIMDVLTFETAHMNLIGMIQHYQQEDLIGLGRLVVALGCNSLQAASRENLPASIQFIAQTYSQDLKNLVTYLLAPPQPGRNRSINDIMPMIGARFYAQLEASQMRIDLLENELSKEIENGRLFRLLSKLGTVNERPEFNMDSTWSETGDRYLLKLFRDYLFHQVTEDGRPWIDMAHVVQCLNKLDAGVPEKISLMSRDGQNVLVVSYSDLRRCLAQAFRELLQSSGEPIPQ